MHCLKRRTLLIVVGAILVCIGCSAEVSESRIDELAESMTSVDCKTGDDVRRIFGHAATSNRAVLFIHVDWNSMKSQRRQFAEFAAAYHDTYPRSDVLFHYVDCTPVTQGYAPLRELDGWYDSRDGTGPSYACGDVVWMDDDECFTWIRSRILSRPAA